ncbi:DUF3558 domain-containing protein [Streptomyces naganishii]|uniref:Secreted serine-rich protein n=1 Tax=Streptomyces naganishii JCM 4654 TaxID=1306179 RepID=A0A918Y7U9_9ACTN|nr:DUF3558 domain-containing protein [Streptomyces naganishii]GHD93914.1 hypothetical protein GCM10010508_52540 [Streptomyces naganishii JCM 4654]
MLRKAYVPGAAALLAALLLGGCTGGSSGDGRTDNANPGGAGTATAAAQPGKYRTLPEACGAVRHDTLDSLLPGIKQITDVDQRTKAYEGEATLTYDTDRKVGCRWKVESTDATDHLHVDFERVVSYDNAVSDDSQAEAVFATKQAAADLPAPTATSPSAGSSTDGSGKPGNPGGPGAGTATPSPSSSAASSDSPGSSATPSGSSSPSTDPADIQPRTLDDLGDEAFIDDTLGTSGSTAQQRTVTVAFRTSNVIVTIEYEEQPAMVGVVPDSKEMQDKARKLAAQLADSLGG